MPINQGDPANREIVPFMHIRHDRHFEEPLISQIVEDLLQGSRFDLLEGMRVVSLSVFFICSFYQAGVVFN